MNVMLFDKYKLRTLRIDATLRYTKPPGSYCGKFGALAQSLSCLEDIQVTFENDTDTLSSMFVAMFMTWAPALRRLALSSSENLSSGILNRVMTFFFAACAAHPNPVDLIKDVSITNMGSSATDLVLLFDVTNLTALNLCANDPSGLTDVLKLLADIARDGCPLELESLELTFLTRHHDTPGIPHFKQATRALDRSLRELLLLHTKGLKRLSIYRLAIPVSLANDWEDVNVNLAHALHHHRDTSHHLGLRANDLAPFLHPAYNVRPNVRSIGTNVGRDIYSMTGARFAVTFCQVAVSIPSPSIPGIARCGSIVNQKISDSRARKSGRELGSIQSSGGTPTRIFN